MTDGSTGDRLYKLLADVLGLDRSTLSDSSSPHNVEEWDSFNHLMVVAAIENEFQIHVTIDEAIGMKSVAIIRDYLRAKGLGD